MKRRVLAIAMTAGLALAGTACSADSNGPGPTTGETTTTTTPGGGQQSDTPDPCALLTLAEVSAQVGEEFTVAKELPAGGLPGQRTCSFEVGADSSATVSLGVWPFDPADVDSFIDEVIGLSAPTEIGQFDGLGDRAFGEPQSLWVLAGNIMVNVSIIFAEMENVDPILQLGLKAVGRL